MKHPLLRTLLAASVVLGANPAYAKHKPLPTSPDLGKAEGRCRVGETGPALLFDVVGLKDRAGRLKLEVYPDNDDDFLADDNVLVNAGKTFRRVEIETPPSGPITLCVRVPGPGTYSVVLLHDRDSNRKIGLSVDGLAFPGPPRKFCWHKPSAADTTITAGPGITRSTITMTYRSGIFCFAPLK